MRFTPERVYGTGWTLAITSAVGWFLCLVISLAGISNGKTLLVVFLGAVATLCGIAFIFGLVLIAGVMLGDAAKGPPMPEPSAAQETPPPMPEPWAAHETIPPMPGEEPGLGQVEHRDGGTWTARPPALEGGGVEVLIPGSASAPDWSKVNQAESLVARAEGFLARARQAILEHESPHWAEGQGDPALQSIELESRTDRHSWHVGLNGSAGGYVVVTFQGDQPIDVLWGF